MQRYLVSEESAGRAPIYSQDIYLGIIYLPRDYLLAVAGIIYIYIYIGIFILAPACTAGGSPTLLPEPSPGSESRREKRGGRDG